MNTTAPPKSASAGLSQGRFPEAIERSVRAQPHARQPAECLPARVHPRHTKPPLITSRSECQDLGAQLFERAIDRRQEVSGGAANSRPFRITDTVADPRVDHRYEDALPVSFEDERGLPLL